jgi:lysophospholipase L1-like esterase
MIYNNIEFFNVYELEEVKGFNGLRLQRFPKNVRHSVGIKGYERGRTVALHSTGCEIRFVTDSNAVTLFLSTVDIEGEALVYKGDFFHSRFLLKPGVISPIRLEEPPAFSNVNSQILENGQFSAKVWRILFNRYCVVFHGIESYGYAVRPPQENEVPKIKWLAYGSSITHGATSGSFENSYVEQAAKRLNVDVMCYGMAGACHCEKEMVDFLVNHDQWDIATLELGVNMRGIFEPEEFEARVTYLIKAILEKNPGKPVVIITIFPNYANHATDTNNLMAKRNSIFNDILNKIFLQERNPNLYIIEGKDILKDFHGLTCDLLHPSAYGHILMGENLAKKLNPIVDLYVNSLRDK